MNYPKISASIYNALDDNQRDFLNIVQEHFPNVIKDGIVDFDALKEVMGNIEQPEGEEKYELTWAGKHLAKREYLREILGKTLKFKPQDSLNADTTENLYIEGDNLEVMKLLKRNYRGKIKMIYIDPPYNRGDDSFLYPDKYYYSDDELAKIANNIDENGVVLQKNSKGDSKYHSRWLNLMYPRMRLAKELLSQDGVIFISIDDNEQATLKMLCDEVFGDEKLVSIIHCQMSTTQGMKVKAAQEGNIVKNAEYIICYSKDGHKDIATQTPLYDLRPEYDEHYSLYLKKDNTIGQLSELYDYRFPKDCYNKKPYKLSEAFKKSEEFADIVRSHLADIVRSHLADIVCSDKVTGFELSDELKNGYWKEIERNGKKYLLTLDLKGQIRQLLRLKDSWGKTDGFYEEEGLRKIRGNWWDGFYIDMGNVSKEGGIEFPNGKKPIRLIKQLIKMCCCKDDIILDFFSGSATTAHAVMKLNSEDGGNRKFIMVQIPEKCDNKSEAYKAGFKNICEIGKERIRRAGKKIKEDLLAEIEKRKKEIKDTEEKLEKEKVKLPLNEDNISKFEEKLIELNEIVIKKEEILTNLDIGFKCFATADTNIQWIYDEIHKESDDKSIHEYTSDNIKGQKDRIDFTPGFTDLDVVYELMLRQNGIPLSTKIEKLSDISDRTYIFADTCVVCLDDNITDLVVTKLAEIEPIPAIFFLRDSAFGDDIALKDYTYRKLNTLVNSHLTKEEQGCYSNFRVEFI